MAPITINGNHVDPAQMKVEQLPQAAKGPFYILLQANQPLGIAETKALSGQNVTIQRLEGGPQTYLCQCAKIDLPALEKLKFIDKAMVYSDSFVVHPMLKSGNLRSSATVRTKDGGSSKDGLLCEVDVVLHDGTTQHGDEVLAEIQKLAPTTSIEKIQADSHRLRVWLPAQLLDKVAAITCVAGVFPAAVKTPTTVKALHLMNCPSPFDTKRPSIVDSLKNWYSGKEAPNVDRWEGDGQIIAVLDEGLDTGKFALESQHPAFKGRIANTSDTQHIDGVDTAFPLYDDHVRSHGTHVAGCAAGKYEYAATNSSCSQMSGTAPAAQVYVLKRFDEITFAQFAHHLASLSGKNLDVKIHTNSWSTEPSEGAQRAYVGSEAPDIDQATIDDENYLVLFGAGNHGEYLLNRDKDDGFLLNRQIGAEAASKNCLTVGASWNTREMEYEPDGDCRFLPRACIEGSFPDGNYPPRLQHGFEQPRSVAPFSSKGPTYDGFLKPDVIAPGTGVLSAWSRYDPPSSSNSAKRKAPVLPDKEKQNMFIQGNKPAGTKPPEFPSKYENGSQYDLMEFQSGTSMATPMVAGIAARLRQAFMATRQAIPKAATLKGLIINGAVSCQGSFGFYKNKTGQWVEFKLGNPPDCTQGHGHVEYERSMRHIRDSYNDWQNFTTGGVKNWGHVGLEEVSALTMGLQSEIFFSPLPEETRCRVTLTYNDKSGALLQRKLEISLELQIYDTVKKTVEVVGEPRGPDLPKRYPDMDVCTDATDKLILGNVQKISWDGFTFPKRDLTQDQKYRFKIVVRAVEVVPATDAVNFSVCWLCDK